jgi:hypothetical protein
MPYIYGGREVRVQVEVSGYWSTSVHVGCYAQAPRRGLKRAANPCLDPKTLVPVGWNGSRPLPLMAPWPSRHLVSWVVQLEDREWPVALETPGKLGGATRGPCGPSTIRFKPVLIKRLEPSVGRMWVTWRVTDNQFLVYHNLTLLGS